MFVPVNIVSGNIDSLEQAKDYRAWLVECLSTETDPVRLAEKQQHLNWMDEAIANEQKKDVAYA